MKTIIVGNGPIDGKGALIDSFDNVIRIHNGIDHPEYAKDVGTKTTIWAARLEKFSNPEAIKNFKETHPDIEVWDFNQESGELKEASPRGREKYKIWPTTGLLCAIKAAGLYKEVSAVGFGLVEGEKLHFFEDENYKPGGGEKHDGPRELEIMKELGIKLA